MRRKAEVGAATALLAALIVGGTEGSMQTPASPEEARLLAEVAERPTDPAPFVALAHHYYESRRLELALRTLTAGLAVARAEDTRPAPPPAAPGVYRAGIDVPLPVRTRDELPTPSRAALESGAVGIVTVEVVIDEEGRVTRPQVVESVPRLDDSVVDAVRRWRFEPTTTGGTAVPVTATLAVDVTYRSDPQPDRDLAVAAVYLRRHLYGQAEPPIERALAGIRGELQCYGSDAVSAARPRAGQPGRGGRAAGPATVPPPQKIFDVQPRYPPAAQQAQVQGVVILEALVGRDGAVRCARVLRSIPMLDQAALDAVRQWRYAPATINGAPVEFFLNVTVRFSVRRAASR